MNIIENAIKNNFHLSGDEILDAQTWEECRQFMLQKNLFVFGAGQLLEILCDTWLKGCTVEGVLDNDAQKQEMDISDYCSYTESVIFKNHKIKRADVLLDYKKEDTVVLITNIRSYMEIIGQIRAMGYTNCYVAVIMVAKEKDTINWDKYTREYDIQEYSNYPIAGRKIIFYAMGRYSGHGKAITESLLAFRNDLDLVWIVTNEHLKAKVPSGVRVVCVLNRRKVVYEMETAKCWIYENPVSTDYIKRLEQYYIQIKHWSSITLKTFGSILHKFRNESEAVALWQHNGRIMDYIFVGSDFDEKTCRQGFCFEKEAIRVGSPRSDILFKGQEIKDKIFSLWHIDKEIRIALYAPTFRIKEGGKASKNIQDIPQIDFYQVKKALERKFGGKWIFFLRFHPMHSVDKIGSLPSFIKDVTQYEDGEELVAVSDIMITDYSSIMFEGAYIEKPVFLYAADYKEYTTEEREFWIDYNTLPFPLAESNEELCQCITDFDREKYERDVTDFLNKYGVHEDGHASERAAAFIIELLKKGNQENE